MSRQDSICRKDRVPSQSYRLVNCVGVGHSRQVGDVRNEISPCLTPPSSGVSDVSLYVIDQDRAEGSASTIKVRWTRLRRDRPGTCGGADTQDCSVMAIWLRFPGRSRVHAREGWPIPNDHKHAPEFRSPIAPHILVILRRPRVSRARHSTRRQARTGAIFRPTFAGRQEMGLSRRRSMRVRGRSRRRLGWCRRISVRRVPSLDHGSATRSLTSRWVGFSSNEKLAGPDDTVDLRAEYRR